MTGAIASTLRSRYPTRRSTVATIHVKRLSIERYTKRIRTFKKQNPDVVCARCLQPRNSWFAETLQKKSGQPRLVCSQPNRLRAIKYHESTHRLVHQFQKHHELTRRLAVQFQNRTSAPRRSQRRNRRGVRRHVHHAETISMDPGRSTARENGFAQHV